MSFPRDAYPYTNFHELNLGYFIVHFREIFSQWADLYDQMLNWKDATDEELATWKAGVEADLDQREAALRAELETWKAQTGQDIAGWEDATLAALTAWQTATQAVFEAIRVEAAGSASAAAASAGDAATAKTAAETAQAAAEAAAASVQASAAQITTNTEDIADLKTQLSNVSGDSYNILGGTLPGKTINNSGVITNSTDYDMSYAPCIEGHTYTVHTDDASRFVGGFFSSVPALGSISYNSARIIQSSKTITAPITGYIAFRTNIGYAYPQIVEGTTDKSYVPVKTAYDYEARAEIEALNTSETVNTARLTQLSFTEQFDVNWPAWKKTAEKMFIELYYEGDKPDYDIYLFLVCKRHATYGTRIWFAKDDHGGENVEQYTVPSSSDYLPTDVFKIGSHMWAIVNWDLFAEGANITFNIKMNDRMYNVANSPIIKSYLEQKSIDTDILQLPDKYDLIAGDTFELFKYGILNVYNDRDYDIVFTSGSNIGKEWARKYEYTPSVSDVGNHTLNVNLMDNHGKIVDSKELVLQVHAVPTSPASEKVILCMGDSLTVGGQWPIELHRRLAESGGTPAGYNLSNIKFIGTKIYLTNPDCKWEGYGGWDFNSYMSPMIGPAYMNIFGNFEQTDEDQHSLWEDGNGNIWSLETISASEIKIIRSSSSGTLPSTGNLTWISGGVHTNTITYSSSAQAPGNPFWDADLGRNNYSKYMEYMGVTKIDRIIILLGWNNANSTEESYKSHAKAFINSVLDEIPDCKFTLLGLQRPSRDGCANNYGISRNYMDMVRFVWKMNNWLKDITQDYPSGTAEFINIAGQFDTEYCCITTPMPINTRVSTTVSVQTNGVHPANSGYMQIADAVTRNLAANL